MENGVLLNVDDHVKIAARSSTNPGFTVAAGAQS